MPNPVLNPKAFNDSIKESQAGFAAAERGTYIPPMSDGSATPWRNTITDVMTMNGTISATAVLFALLIGAGVYGWTAVDSVDKFGNLQIPGTLYPALFVALGLAILTSFKPKIARFTAPLYALAEGVLLGMISKIYDVRYPGIASSAALGTLCVFGAMLFLYRTRIIKVTDKLRRTVMAATMGVFLLYMIGMVARLFGGNVGFINNASGLSIVISLVVVGVAAFNLMLDFDMIEKGVANGAPKYMEWYCAFGLMVTVVWLYMELLRLLSKLRDR